MFYFTGCALCLNVTELRQKSEGFPIRKSSDQRLLGTSPKRIAAMLRPSSPSSSQGIHRTPLSFLLGNLKTTYYFPFCQMASISTNSQNFFMSFIPISSFARHLYNLNVERLPHLQIRKDPVGSMIRGGIYLSMYDFAHIDPVLDSEGRASLGLE
jgi:hypothetical protein